VLSRRFGRRASALVGRPHAQSRAPFHHQFAMDATSNITTGGDGILCGIANNYAGSTFTSFLLSWLAITTIALVALFTLSGGLFYYYYVDVTYEKWRNKSNPTFPPPEKVKEEITQMLKGLFTATVAPSLSLWLSANGGSKAFCGWHDRNGVEYGAATQVGMFFGIWLASDFFEFFYHYCGHRFHFLWMQHKFHHRFFNPT
jgi:lathosterol oxidase